jgi:hypothetical protein
MNELQDKINKLYPPTHTFEIGPPPKATGVLAQRMAIIERHFPEFLQGVRLLDIGCSKGFMSLVMSGNYSDIVGIDPDADAIDTCTKLAHVMYGGDYAKILFHNMTFRDFSDTHPFDRIFIGNGPHHLYREVGGHEWIGKLAALSSDLVITEGPLDRSCPDLAADPDTYTASYDSFVPSMKKYFKLVSKVPSVAYSPQRYVCLWQRRPMIPPKTRTFEKRLRHDVYTDNNKVDIFVASTSPVSNGLAAFTENGWLENFDADKPIRYFENERVGFGVHCENQIYLATLGYVDVDPATINIFRTSLRCFDKSGVLPILKLEHRHIGLYFYLLLQSYKNSAIIGPSMVEPILGALTSRSASGIEEVFRWAKSQL